MTTANLMFAIIGTGVSLAALIIGLVAWLRADLNHLRDRMDDRLSAVEQRMDDRLSAVELSQAKLEGLLEGLREAIVGRSP